MTGEARPSRALDSTLMLLFLSVSIAGLVIRLLGHVWGDALIVAGAVELLIANLWRRRRLRSPN